MTGINQYKNNQISTASPEQLLIMLYDGAIRFTNQAAAAIEEKKIDARNTAVNKAIAILTELSTALDHKVGGELTANLEALYDYMIRELTRANVKNDPEPLATVTDLLKDLRETWMQAIEMNRKSPDTGIMQDQTATGTTQPGQQAYANGAG